MNLESQVHTVGVLVAGLSTAARDADAGKALIRFLTSPAAAPVYKAKGLEPG